MGWDYFERFPKSTPRQAKGGIKAQTQRGSFGQSWWAKRWIAVLEGFDIGSRLARGRSYARSGQVLAVDIQPGKVKAKVQGSRPTPYAVTVAVATLSPAEREKFSAALASQVLFTAKLLAGEMPQDIEQAFTAAGLSLFPERSTDLDTDCSCPDWSNPCKHIAAVYYLLGEEFDRDPFLLFKLRGINREEMLKQLGGVGAQAKPALKSAAPAKRKVGAGKAATAHRAEAGEREPLVHEPEAFWHGLPVPDGFPGATQLPPVAASLPKRLGNFPFWRGAQRLQDSLEPFYSQASASALDRLSDSTGK